MARGDLTDDILYGDKLSSPGLRWAHSAPDDEDEQPDPAPRSGTRLSSVDDLIDSWLVGQLAEAPFTGRNRRLRTELTHLIARSGVLRNPTENNREYEALIGIQLDGGARVVFVGATSHGPAGRVGSQGNIVYEGPSLSAACDAVNGKLQEKYAKGYVGTTQQTLRQIYPRNVLDQASELLQS